MNNKEYKIIIGYDEYGIYQDYLTGYNMVIAGNKNYEKIEQADFWVEAKRKFEKYEYYPEELTQEEFDKIDHIYNCNNDDYNIYFEIARQTIRATITKKEICGYCQGEWNYIVYDTADEDINPDYIEALYFGKYKELNIIDPEDNELITSLIITDDELWNATRTPEKAKSEFEKLTGYKIGKICEYKEVRTLQECELEF